MNIISEKFPCLNGMLAVEWLSTGGTLSLSPGACPRLRNTPKYYMDQLFKNPLNQLRTPSSTLTKHKLYTALNLRQIYNAAPSSQSVLSIHKHPLPTVIQNFTPFSSNFTLPMFVNISQRRPNALNIGFIPRLILRFFFRTAPLNGFSQSEAIQANGGIFVPPVFLTGHCFFVWSHGVITYDSLMHHCLKIMHCIISLLIQYVTNKINKSIKFRGLWKYV